MAALPGLVSDRLELLALELHRAARGMVQIMALVVATAILGTTAWLVLCSGIGLTLVALGLPWPLALLAVLLFNLALACVGVVIWLGWRWSHRPDPARLVSVEVPANVAGHDVDGLADLPWAGLTAVGWPLVPEAWRGNLSPAAAATVVSTVLSIGRRLLRRRVR